MHLSTVADSSRNEPIPICRKSTPSPTLSPPDLGVALVNLHIHGCVDVEAANQLCDLDLAVPATFARRVAGIGLLSFEALELELTGYIEINRIDQARAIRHRFVQDAVARTAVDQFAREDRLVFGRSYLEGLTDEDLAVKDQLTAAGWRRR